jgi:hypothetical protein
VLNDVNASLTLYKRVLHLDASNVEAMACMASHHFYTDQPEVALRFYRYGFAKFERRECVRAGLVWLL